MGLGEEDGCIEMAFRRKHGCRKWEEREKKRVFTYTFRWTYCAYSLLIALENAYCCYSVFTYIHHGSCYPPP